jgi:hypothetical protein
MMLRIIYPCFNNYDLMFGENADFLIQNRENIIVIDDHSSDLEIEKGKKWCKEHDVQFKINPGKGIPSAVDYIVHNCCDENDWLLVMQQDVRFVDVNAVSKLDKRLDFFNRNGYQIGAIGFPNFVSSSHYHPDAENLESVTWKQCWLGLFTLSSSAYYKPANMIDNAFRMISRLPVINQKFRKFWHKVIFHRNFAPSTFPNFLEISRNYEGVSAVELPVWTSVAINTIAWRKSIILDSRFIFHLWFPDIANQLMNENWYVCNDTDFIVHNNWKIKFKYDQLGSVEEGKKIDGKMESYGNHLIIWKDKWGYDYEDPYPSRGSNPYIKQGSVLELMINHIPSKPLKKFDVTGL